MNCIGFQSTRCYFREHSQGVVLAACRPNSTPQSLFLKWDGHPTLYSFRFILGVIMITLKAGAKVVRLLPPLVVKATEIRELLEALESVLEGSSGAAP